MKAFPSHDVPEFQALKKLNTAIKIQDFLDGMPINFERRGETCRSPLFTLRHKEAHCMEGALLAAAALWYQGEPPLLLDLKTMKGDDDHVVALFRENGRWGAISKTNHAVLRYRDPIFKSVRELAMSYFNEYFLDDGRKTMRSFSRPFDLSREKESWLTTEDDLWQLAADLDDSPHEDILPKGKTWRLRRADKIEIDAGKLLEWKG